MTYFLIWLILSVLFGILTNHWNKTEPGDDADIAGNWFAAIIVWIVLAIVIGIVAIF